MKVIHYDEVQRLLGVSRTTLWRWERNGLFPARIKLGPNSVAWSEAEVAAWLASRPRPSARHQRGEASHAE